MSESRKVKFMPYSPFHRINIPDLRMVDPVSLSNELPNYGG